MNRAIRILVERRIGLVVGIAGLFCGALLYKSSENQDFLRRYSPTFAALLAVLVVALIGTITYSVFSPRQKWARSASPALFELACGTWGAAFLASAVSDPDYGARLLDLNFFASPFPVAALFEFLTLSLLLAAAAIAGARRVKGALLNLGLVVTTLGILLLFGEAVARAVAFAGAQTHGIPSYSGMVFSRRYVHLNSGGFRDSEHAIDRRAGVRRLLLVGDSYAFGAGIRNTAERFGEQLQSELTRQSGQHWEVINTSLPDKNTLQEIAFLRRGLAYSPEGVLLLYVFNDADYLASAVGTDASPKTPTARAVTARNPIFEHPTSVAGRLDPLRIAYWNSFLFQEAYVRWRLIRIRMFRSAGAQIDSDVYRTPNLLTRHLQDLARVVEIADSGGVPAWILPIDLGVPSDPDLTDRYQTFLAAARAQSLPVWSLEEVYRGQKLRDLTVNQFDAHPNALGFRLAVTAIVPRVLGEMDSLADSKSSE